MLVVNDDSAIRKLIQDVLETEGYTVETASDGDEALMLLRQSRLPFVLLLDDFMPVMDGTQVLETLVAEPELAQRTACEYYTLRQDEQWETLVQLLHYFQAPVLPMPFSVQQLLHALELAMVRLRSP